jgi:tyrosyl-tRNA synthetase
MTAEKKIKFPPVNEQIDLLKSSVEPVEIIREEELEKLLENSIKTGKPLRIKQGFDASSPDLHIGHGVSIWKLRAFQKLGHTIVFIIGDFTAMIGDPTGKSKTRPRLTREQVEINSQTYRNQVFRILDEEKTEIRFNSEWHAKRNIYEFLELTSHYTVRRMLERDDFWKRFKAEQPISMLEFLYPLVQAYDSVAINADVELGGTDQKFNLMLARQIQRSYGQEPEVAFMMPLMRGTDGDQKMSKSLNNDIGISDEANNMYGKIMSISDALIAEYFTYGSGLDQAQIEQITAELEPYPLKHLLAKIITGRYWSSDETEAAAEIFSARFKDKKWPTPKELIEPGLSVQIDQDTEYLPRIIVAAKAAKSNGEAMRLLKSGAVSVDEKKVTDLKNLDIKLDKPFVLKVGKRRFFLIYRNEEQLARLN